MREAWGAVRLSLLGLSAFSGAPRPQADGYQDDPAGYQPSPPGAAQDSAGYHPSPLEASRACDGGGAAGGAGQGGGGEEGGEQGPPSSEDAFSALPVARGSGGLSPPWQAEGGAATPRLALTLTLTLP